MKMITLFLIFAVSASGASEIVEPLTTFYNNAYGDNKVYIAALFGMIVAELRGL